MVESPKVHSVLGLRATSNMEGSEDGSHQLMTVGDSVGSLGKSSRVSRA